jgi:SAM-dependent methyltransferase
MNETIDRSEGRRLFGRDPQGYDAVRPDYPPELYSYLTQRGAVGPGSTSLEIGAGNGLATAQLIALGADPITIVEPDQRFAPLLRKIAARADAHCVLVHDSFENADLGSGAFDFVASATAFHWVEQTSGLRKVAQVLKPGGYCGLWWNVFQVLGAADPFHDATFALLADLATTPSGAPNSVPFALDTQARKAGFADTGLFEEVEQFEMRWTLQLTAAEVGKLYEGFPQIQRLPDDRREQLIKQLVGIAETQFGGHVERGMTSVLYLARRTG